MTQNAHQAVCCDAEQIIHDDFDSTTGRYPLSRQQRPAGHFPVSSGDESPLNFVTAQLNSLLAKVGSGTG